MINNRKKIGLIGYPLGHSLSPRIHQHFAEYDYQLLETPADQFANLLEEKDFAGLNVTIPYKQAVIPYLDQVAELAQEIGAVNTIVNQQGKLSGYNTDFAGLAYLLAKADIELQDKNVVILGSGGAGQMAACLAKHHECSSCHFYSIRQPLAVLPEKYQAAHVIINASPVGMYPHNLDQRLELNQFPNLEAVVDLIYNPLKTQLVLEAEDRGLKAVGGLAMLVAQAFYASQLFSAKELDSTILDRVCTKEESQLRNWILIGMPGVGKSTTAKALGQLTGRQVLDSDQILESQFQQTIADYLQNNGETAFRKAESQVIQELGAKQGVIIATGGGAVLNQTNQFALRQNGDLIWLDRPLNQLATQGRPLSRSSSGLAKLWQERQAVYERLAQIKVSVSPQVEITCQRLLKGIKGHEINGH